VSFASADDAQKLFSEAQALLTAQNFTAAAAKARASIAASPADAAPGPLAQSWELLANAAPRYNDWQEAASAYANAIRLRTLEQGSNGPKVGEDLRMLARVCVSLKKAHEAEAAYKRAIEIEQSLYGDAAETVINMSVELSDLLASADRKADASVWTKKTLSTCAAQKSSPRCAINVWVRLADQQVKQDDVTGAADTYAEILVQSEKSYVTAQDRATALSAAGYFHLTQGETSLAVAQLRRALDLLEKTEPSGSLVIARSQVWLAQAYMQTSQSADYQNATRLLRSASSAFRTARGPESQEAIAAAQELATAYTYTQEYDNAISLYSEVLRSVVKKWGTNSQAELSVLSNLAQAQGLAGRLTDQETTLATLVSKTQAMGGIGNAAGSAAHINLGAFKYGNGAFKEAQREFEAALALDGAANTADRNTFSIALGDAWLARALMAQGDYSGALRAAQTNIPILADVERQNPGVAIQTLKVLSESFVGSDRPMEALPYAWRALQIEEKRNNYPFLEARIAQRDKILANARDYAAQSQSDDSHRSIANWAKFVAATAYQVDKTNGGVFSKLFYATQSSMLSPTTISVQRAAARRSAPSQEAADLLRQQQDALGSLAILSQELADQASLANDQNQTRQLRAKVDASISALENINQRLRRIYPRYSDYIDPKPIDLAAAQALLAPGDAIVLSTADGAHVFNILVTKEDFAFHDFAWTFAIEKDGSRQQLSGGTKEIQGYVDRIVCSIDSAGCKGGMLAPAPNAFDLEAAYSLYRAILGPFEDKLSSVRHIYVVADGDMARIPLGLLITKPATSFDDASWLSDRFSITRLPSISSLSLAKNQAKPAYGEDFVGYGDPILQGSARPQQVDLTKLFSFDSRGQTIANVAALRTLQPLSGTKFELQESARLFRSNRTILRLQKEATEAAFKSDAAIPTARVVSIATHGLLPKDIGDGAQEGGLVFSPPQTPTITDDGLLTPSEILALNFRAEWIILSACNTATAEQAGDTFSGLTRAFLFSGGTAVLASHWRVNDEATARLVSATLRMRVSNDRMTHAEALQAAMKEVRTDPRFQHPRYWAAFSVISNDND